MPDQLPDHLKNWILISDALKRPETVRYKASPEICGEIASLYDLRNVEAFSYEFEIEAWRKQGLRVKGVVNASVTQSCVVTLEPVPATIREEVDLCFMPEDSVRHRPDGARGDVGGKEIMIDPEADDPTDLFSGNRLDVAAPAFEHFALGLDPYPRLEGAHLPDDKADEEDESETGRESPFAALKVLQDRLKS